MSELSYLEKLLDGAEVEWKTLDDVGEFLRGKRFVKSDIISEGVPCIHYGELYTHYGIWAEDTKSFLDDSIAEKLRVANYGDVIIVAAGETIEDIGNGTAWLGKHDVVFHDACFSFKSRLHPKYTSYYLRTQIFKEQIKNSVSSGKISSINAKGLGKARIPIPCPNNPEKSLAIQSEIVRILDKFTALTAELTAELTARKKQYNYYRDQLLSFEEGEVEWKALGEITNISSASRVHKNEWTIAGVPFFRTSDVISIFNGVKNSRDDAFISNELYEKLSSKSGKLQKDDILVTGGGTIGIPYIVPSDDPLYFKDADLLCIRKSKMLNSKFLYHYCLTTKFRAYLEAISNNSTIAHYTISQAAKTPVPVPSIAEQARIVAILDKFDSLNNSITEGLPREIELRQKQYEYYRDLLFSFPKPESVTE